jgi:hypothetical protein
LPENQAVFTVNDQHEKSHSSFKTLIHEAQGKKYNPNPMFSRKTEPLKRLVPNDNNTDNLIYTLKTKFQMKTRINKI